MNVSEEKRDGVLLLHVAGRLDSVSSADLEKLLIGHINGGELHVVLDLEQLEYVSSAGLRILLLAAKRLKQAGGSFVLCSLRDPIRDVLKLSGFLAVLDVRGGCEEALSG